MTPDQPDSGPATPVNFANTRPQVGPIAAGPGTLRSTYQALKADPNIQSLAAGVGAAHPQDEAFRGIRTTVGSARAGYQYGRQLGQSWVGAGQQQPDSAADSGQPSGNGDGGAPELATAESLDSLHSKVDALQGSVSGMASSGAAGGQAQSQQPGPQAQQQQRETPANPMLAQAQQHQAALESMVGSHQNLAQTRSNQAAHFQQRQQAVSAVGVAPAASAIGMSSAYAQKSFYGQQGSGIGTSDANWESARWSR